jgi:hypothetical protein
LHCELGASAFESRVSANDGDDRAATLQRGFSAQVYLCASGVLQMTVTPFAGIGRNLLKGVLFAPCAPDHRPRSADYLLEAVVVDDSTNSPRLLRPAHIVQGCA